MARPAQFDREEVLVKAQQLFCRQGYTATSMPQLLEVMDIRPSSFYSSFGSKRDLYRECLKQYTDSYQSLVDKIAQSDDPLQSLERYFAITFVKNQSARLASGCLVINTSIELEDVDAELHRLARAQIKNVESAFRQCFANAQAVGGIRTDLSAQNLAEFFSTVNAGIRVKMRAGVARASLIKQVEFLIQFLGIDRSSSTFSS